MINAVFILVSGVVINLNTIQFYAPSKRSPEHCYIQFAGDRHSPATFDFSCNELTRAIKEHTNDTE